MDQFVDLLNKLAGYSWNLPLIMVLVGTGTLFTLLLFFIQWRKIGHAFYVIRGDYDDPDDEGDITHFQALCAALSATIGVGNIAGVATALHYGGPGAIFWMWVAAFVGMATKYATCLLAQKYRHVHPDGSVSGGPMYFIEKGLGDKFTWMAVLFAFFATIASFGGGNMVQSNSMAEAFVNSMNPRLKMETKLADLNDNQGVGETAGDDFSVRTRSGQTFGVDIHGAHNLEELLAKINNHPENKGRRMKASINRGRLVLKDLSQGKGRFKVTSRGQLTEQLRLLQKEAPHNLLSSDQLPEKFPGAGEKEKGDGDKKPGEKPESSLKVELQNGTSFTVDLTGAEKWEDIVEAVNKRAEKGQLEASLSDGQIYFRDGTEGENNFTLTATGPLATSLGLAGKVARKDTLTTEELPENLLALNKGRGLEATLEFELRDGTTFAVNLASVQTVEDLVRTINTSPNNRLVEAKIHLDEKQIRLIDYTDGETSFKVSPQSKSMDELGLKYNKEKNRYYSRQAAKKLTEDSPITALNQDRELSQGPGADLQIRLRDGSRLLVELEGAKTVGDFLQRINIQSENISAKISPENRRRISITDLTQGKGDFIISPYSSTLDDLWLTKYEATGERPKLITSHPPRRQNWRIALGLFIAIAVWLVIVGGIKRIGNVASKLVPFMATFYILGALTILALHFEEVPGAIGLIIYHAFNSTDAVGGGFLGASVIMTITWGVRRAVFSNEAGLGSAPIAHAAAKTDEPVREGLVAMVGPFIDTIIVCTMTALVIIVTNQWQLGENGAALTQDAFTVGLPGGLGGLIVALGLILFAFSTSISWSYYGDRCVEYLFGPRAITPYRWIFCVFLFIGATWKIEAVWAFADITMAAMAFPNLVATVALSGVVLAMTKDYFSREHIPYWEESKDGKPKDEKDGGSKEKTPTSETSSKTSSSSSSKKEKKEKGSPRDVKTSTPESTERGKRVVSAGFDLDREQDEVDDDEEEKKSTSKKKDDGVKSSGKKKTSSKKKSTKKKMDDKGPERPGIDEDAFAVGLDIDSKKSSKKKSSGKKKSSSTKKKSTKKKDDGKKSSSKKKSTEKDDDKKSKSKKKSTKKKSSSKKKDDGKKSSSKKKPTKKSKNKGPERPDIDEDAFSQGLDLDDEK